ncbi:hypothetical protein [Rhodohalobacter barkolensis]|uniref:DUF1579 domain-containing protein n=1 Tax=Rhodohalobacter barkolensis TaxID=2053187 RepID=A0A2N0VHP9_9BACT|nr:hypothetical protein [Rhodohalobacter barkolensis]PKD43721.1 hypothetical protein CWD77_09180 [Rhodohalobacter barkolensis]
MKKIFLIVLLILTIFPDLYAQKASRQPAKVAELIAQFRGEWSCKGAFTKDNRPLEASITFTPAMEGKALEYEHKDLPPNSFHALGLWNVDSASNTLTYTFVSTLKGSKEANSRYFVGNVKDTKTLVLTADTLAAAPFRENRYVYEIKSKDEFKYQWQVYADGIWNTGDYLNCRKTL